LLLRHLINLHPSGACRARGFKRLLGTPRFPTLKSVRDAANASSGETLRFEQGAELNEGATEKMFVSGGFRRRLGRAISQVGIRNAAGAAPNRQPHNLTLKVSLAVRQGIGNDVGNGVGLAVVSIPPEEAFDF
jgi:hypothetical protein